MAIPHSWNLKRVPLRPTTYRIAGLDIAYSYSEEQGIKFEDWFEEALNKGEIPGKTPVLVLHNPFRYETISWKDIIVKNEYYTKRCLVKEELKT